MELPEGLERKNQTSTNSQEIPQDGSSSSSSLTLPLPDDKQSHSIEQSISEHLDSSQSESAEHDRSDQEIEISYLPSLTLLNLPSDEEVGLMPSSLINPETDIISFNENNSKNVGVNMQSILDEILRSDQFLSDQENNITTSHESSFNIFENVDFNDSSLNKYNEKVDQYTIKHLKELLASKGAFINALTAEVESLKELTGSNHSTLSLNTNSTEYKQVHEELQTKIIEFQSVISHRDNTIEQLTNALQDSIENRELLEQQSGKLAQEVENLHRKLVETSEIINSWNPDENLIKQLKTILNCPSEQIVDIVKENSLKLSNLQNKFDSEKMEHKNEVLKLRELLASIKCDSTDIVQLREELEVKHTKEMEELRTYFEQKCSDMEKHYSEEINSQHSRKLSGSSNSDQIDFNLSEHTPGSGGDMGDTKSVTINYLKENLKVLCDKVEEYNQQNLSKDDLTVAFETFGNCLKFPEKTVENASKIEMENQYEEKIKVLKYELDNALKHVNSAVQEVASSGEYELAEVVQSYERRLQEQVLYAKNDIIIALEHQIQMLVLSESLDENQWPTELLQLRKRFVEKYETEIAELNTKHTEEIEKLKEDHLRNLNGALERAKRRSLKDESVELETIAISDKYRKTNSLLFQIVNDLLKYFNDCENELNNTLIDQLLKLDLDKNMLELMNDSSNSTSSELQSNASKRVHFAPQFEELLSTIEHSQLESKDLSIEVKNELGACLTRLRTEANAILTLSTNVTQKPADNTDLLDELKEAKNLINCLELEKDNLEHEVEQLIAKQDNLEVDLRKCREKIIELIENGHKEIISEGYGEGSKSVNPEFGEAITLLMQVQEKARGLLSENTDVKNPLVEIIEQLVHEGERFKDETKKDRDDLNQQINAADKKLRATCHFLEEQATEREQERDEAQKEILSLREQLKEREKDRVNCERINREVEHFEQQMRDMSKLIDEYNQREKTVEIERNEAVDKVLVLRDIIRDLELQIESKNEIETELRDVISRLEEIIKLQNKSNEDLNNQLEASKNGSHYQEEIEHLRDQVQRLNLNAELIGSEGVFKQIKLQLNEIETNLDKRTRDLEALHSVVSNTTCSSPSEDMSVRDQIRPKTPNPLDECDIPLQQLARLKEKLTKHARVEDAAVKRIHDLEMQFDTIKRDLEEVQNERDILQDQLSEQLVLISSLQIRLDDQRLRTEQVQKQTNTSLEVRIYDLEHEVKNLMETLHNRDKTIKQLNKTLEETKTRLEQAEKELNNKEDGVVIQLQNEIDRLHMENVTMKLKIDNDAQILPGLVDNIISDKNKDIELLREKLDKTQSELNSFLSINLDVEQLKALSRLQSSDRAFSDILSLLDDKIRREQTSDSLNLTNVYKHTPNETTLLAGKFQPEISSIEQLAPPNINFSTETSIKPNSTEINEKHVHFHEDKLQAELYEKNQVIKEFTKRLDVLNQLEGNINQLQSKLDETESILKETTEKFQQSENTLRNQLEQMRIDLCEKQMQIEDKEEELMLLKDDCKRKDDMYLTLSKEKINLDNLLTNYKEQQLEPLQIELTDKNNKIKELSEQKNEIEKILGNLKKDLKKTKENENKQLKDLIDRDTEIEILNEDVNRYLDDINKLEKKLADRNDQEIKLADLTEKQLRINQLNAQINESNNQIQHLHELIIEKDKIINQMSIDSRSLHTNLESIQNKILETGNIIDLRKLLTVEQQLNASLKDEVKNLKKKIDTSDSFESIGNPDFKDALIKLRVEYEREKDRNKQLNIDLEIEKQNNNAIQLEDANMIQQLRIRLESALENEREFEKEVEIERQMKEQLQLQVDLFKQKISTLSSESSKTDTEYKSLPNHEVIKLRNELQVLQNLNTELKREMKLLKRGKCEIETHLKYAKDLLQLKIDEINKLKSQIEKLQNESIEFKEKFEILKFDLNNKNREVENTRTLITEIDQERINLKKQVENLLGNNIEPGIDVPQQFLNKIKDLSNLVKEHIKDNKRISETVEKLTNERRSLKHRIQSLEELNGKVLIDDPMHRTNHLFSRYLRSESYRKALIWQKRYLFALLTTYQVDINILPPYKSRSRGIKRFKIIAISIQSIIRMKYMVKRWHSGVRGMTYGKHKPRPFDQPWSGTTPPSKERSAQIEQIRFDESDSS